MDDQPLVSLIIRNYNYDSFLRDAVESALGQTYPKVEVIIVDDGSTDKSRIILEQYRECCRILFQSNGGEGSAINSGFAESRGDLVIYLDSDDILLPTAVAEIIAIWRRDIARIHFRLWTMLEDSTLLDIPIPSYEVPALSLEEHLRRFGHVASGGQSFNAYSRWALATILPLDPSVWLRAPDCYLNALTSAQGEIGLIQDPLGGYRLHSANLTLMNSLRVGERNDVVQIHPRLYDAVRNFVGEARWRHMRPRPPTYHWINRILSRRLNTAGHPFQADRLAILAWNALARIFTMPHMAPSRRLFLCGAVFSACLMPVSLLRKALPAMLRFARWTSMPQVVRRRFPLATHTVAADWQAYRVPSRRERSARPVM